MTGHEARNGWPAVQTWYGLTDERKDTMSITLRILLFLASVVSLLFVRKRLRGSRVRMEDMVFWLFLSVLLVVLSIFPQIAISAAGLIGVQSPVNLVYLIILFFLLLQCFQQSLRISELEEKMNRMISDEALSKLADAENRAAPAGNTQTVLKRGNGTEQEE